MKRMIVIFALVIFSLLPLNVFAQPDMILSFQGVLRDQDNKAVEGPHDLTFTFYTGCTNFTDWNDCSPTINNSGNTWQETHTNVPVENGVFSVELGNVDNDLYLVDFNQNIWVSVRLGDGPEMKPFTRLTMAPYALNTISASSIGGGGGDTNVFGETGKVGIGTTDPANRLTVEGTADFNSVGIGITNPNNPLSVNGNADFTGDIDVTGNINVTSQIDVSDTSFVSHIVMGNGSDISGVDRIDGYEGLRLNGSATAEADSADLHIQSDGQIKIGTTKPIEIKRFTNLGSQVNEDTGYPHSVWSAAIIGFDTGIYNNPETESRTYIFVYKNLNGNWYIKANAYDEDNGGGMENWDCEVMFIRRELVNEIDNRDDGWINN